MDSKITILITLVILGWSSFVGADSIEVTPSASQGDLLARQMRQLRLADSVTGILRVRRDQETERSYALTLQSQSLPAGWITTFSAQRQDLETPEIVTIQFSDQSPPRYVLWNSKGDESSGEAKGEVIAAMSAQSQQAFANTDFTLADLGLEFFYWPEQHLIKRQMRRSRACYVLESRLPEAKSAHAYSRVLSWIDQDTKNLVLVEAYDQDNQRVKQFKPDRFKKVDGIWHIKELEMLNLKIDSTTTMILDVPVSE